MTISDLADNLRANIIKNPEFAIQLERGACEAELDVLAERIKSHIENNEDVPEFTRFQIYDTLIKWKKNRDEERPTLDRLLKESEERFVKKGKVIKNGNQGQAQSA